MTKYYPKNYRIFLPLILMLIICQNSLAIPGWQWAKTENGTSEERSYNTATDNHGNVYSVGSFQTSTIIFDSYHLTNAGNEDIFLVKYDPAGNVLWAQSFGDTALEAGLGVECDNSGNVYITGIFKGPTIDFSTFTLNNSGMKDIYLVKLDENGTVLWANSYGGNGDDFGINISTDLNSNVYLAGHFNSPSITFGSSTLIAVGTSKAFVAKFDSNGNALWAGGSKGPSYDEAKCVTVDINGNIYLAADFYDLSVWFDTDTMVSGGDYDMFIVKYDANGVEQWAKSFGNFNPDKITGISVGDNGDVYFTGHFYSPYIQFGSITLNNADFPAWDMFIGKLDLNANVVWAKSAAGNTGEDVIVDLEKSSNGNLLITGWFNDSIILGNTTLTSNGMTDIFAAEIDTSGIFQWAVSTGGSDQDFTYSLSADANGDIIIGGFFKSPSIQFGGTTISDSHPGWDMLVAKLSNPTSVDEHPPVTWNVFPNPADGSFSILIPDENNFSVEVSNSLGQIVLQKFSQENRMSIDTDALSNGIYFLNVETKDEIISKKLIISH